jgi:lysozyme family protein
VSKLQAIAFVLKVETGELTDRADDPGGLTRWGIALNRHPELTETDILNMTDVRAGTIFEKDYWPARADELPDYWSIPLLAAAVVQGKETAVEVLQETLGVGIDGAIGPQTLAAAQLANPKVALARFLANQVRHMRTYKGWPANGVGWVERGAEAILLAVAP